MKVVNSWKIDGMFPVSADTAKQEFDRIYEKHGEISKRLIVEENRAIGSPLHSCFEWRDDIAAEKYRQEQAGSMIRCLVTTVVQDGKKDPIIVRAVVRTGKSYEPISVAIKSEEKTAILISDALREVEHFKRKYAAVKELKNVLDSMSDFEKSVLGGDA